MNEFRLKVAEIIHKETTQIPQKFPHECDFQAADEVLDATANFIESLLELLGEDTTASDGYRLACKDNARLIRDRLTSLRERR